MKEIELEISAHAKPQIRTMSSVALIDKIRSEISPFGLVPCCLIEIPNII